MTQEQKQIYTRRITAANKTQLITILYEMILDYLKDAGTAFEKEDVEGYAAQIRYADSCIDELLRGLNLRYELAKNLQQLYLYAKRELIRASAKREPALLRHAETVFDGLHEAYLQLEKLDTSAPEMENTQTVYAGLTYGRSSLNEGVADPMANRGMTV